MVEGDPAMCYFAKDGAVVFLDNQHRTVSPWTTVQAVFDNDGTDIAYIAVETDDGDSFLFNDIRRTPKGGTLQRVFDLTSISEYDRIVMDDGETLNVDDAEALAEVTAKLAKYRPQPAHPASRIGRHRPRTTCAVGLRAADKIQVRRRPSGVGVVIDQASFVRRIVLSGDRDSNPYWSGSFAVSPL